jgi:hypothetical protein
MHVSGAVKMEQEQHGGMQVHSNLSAPLGSSSAAAAWMQQAPGAAEYQAELQQHQHQQQLLQQHQQQYEQHQHQQAMAAAAAQLQSYHEQQTAGEAAAAAATAAAMQAGHPAGADMHPGAAAPEGLQQMLPAGGQHLSADVGGMPGALLLGHG